MHICLPKCFTGIKAAHEYVLKSPENLQPFVKHPVLTIVDFVKKINLITYTINVVFSSPTGATIQLLYDAPTADGLPGSGPGIQCAAAVWSQADSTAYEPVR